MISKIENKDNQSLAHWLSRETPLNLPMLGDLARYGTDAPFAEYWIQTDEGGVWQALVRRFFEHYTVYVPEAAAAVDYDELRFFLQFSDPGSVAGRVDTVRTLLGDAPGVWEEAASMVLPSDSRLLPPEGYPAPEYATDADADEMGEIIFNTEAFRRNYHQAQEVAEGIRARLGAGGVRHVVLRVADRIVSHANTTAEVPGYALVSGVTTHPEAQRKGYAARLVSFLCRELLREGRMPCLFAKSPAALAMYLRLGFACTGTYATWRRPEPHSAV